MEEGYCQQFWFGGCDGNGNRFDSKEACEQRCVKSEGESSSYNTWGDTVYPTEMTSGTSHHMSHSTSHSIGGG